METANGTVIQTRALSEAWQALPFLPGLSELILDLAELGDDEASPVETVAERLRAAGFVEVDYDREEADQLPLPPPEPDTTNFAFPENWGAWVGPHIGRTRRFLALVEQFIAEVMKEGVPALDGKSGYQDSAFHRLFEVMDHDIIDERLLRISGRASVYEVPYVITDTVSYLAAAAADAERCLHRCGRDGFPTDQDGNYLFLTMREPISELIFQVWDADTDDDYDRIKRAFELAGERTGLRVEWDTERPTVSLADNEQYRPHGVMP
jgi:hypothetical protein